MFNNFNYKLILLNRSSRALFYDFTIFCAFISQTLHKKTHNNRDETSPLIILLLKLVISNLNLICPFTLYLWTHSRYPVSCFTLSDVLKHFSLCALLVSPWFITWISCEETTFRTLFIHLVSASRFRIYTIEQNIHVIHILFFVVKSDRLWF